MSTPGTGDGHDERTAALRRAQQQRLQRFMITFVMVEGVVLAAAVVAVFVLELIDPDLGIWLILAVALLGATALSTGLLGAQARNRRELEELSRR